jgi:hypothetical protein
MVESSQKYKIQESGDHVLYPENQECSSPEPSLHTRDSPSEQHAPLFHICIHDGVNQDCPIFSAAYINCNPAGDLPKNYSTTESLLATLIMIFSINGDLMRVSKNNHLHTIHDLKC